MVTIAAPNLDFFKSPPAQLLSIGVVSAEIVRLLAGTLGLVLAMSDYSGDLCVLNPKQKRSAPDLLTR